LLEYVSKDKTNVVLDRRIGDRNADQEQVMIERFARERNREEKKHR
jgi:hypothetical protein